MKLKKHYALRQLADTWVVIPLSDAEMSFDGMLKLNDTAATLWRTLENGATREELAKAMTEEYEVTYEHALQSADNFLKMLQEAGCLE